MKRFLAFLFVLSMLLSGHSVAAKSLQRALDDAVRIDDGEK